MPRPTGSPRWPRRSRPPIDVLTHPALAQLHPTFGHPDSPERLEVLLEAFPDAREGRPAERSSAERVHAPEYLDGLATVAAPHCADGTGIEIEMTVEAVRHRIPATVVKTPFFNPPRKTAVPAF